MRNGLEQYFPFRDIGFMLIGSAENGKQALEILTSQTVDVALCDIVMPVMSGLDLLTAVRKKKLNTKIVFFSAHENFHYAQEALELGASHYLLKSSSHNELIRVLSKLKNELDTQNQTPPAWADTDISYNEKIITLIKNYTKEHYKDISLENLTSLVHMNPDYISKFFKKYTNMNFSDYVTKIRMINAASLLKEVRYKTYEISEIVGYSNAFNFTRAFKNYFGVSPREYKSGKKTIQSDSE
jgi:YesN/AraC family two-component response regulator